MIPSIEIGTNQAIVTIGDKRYFYSYTTLVGYKKGKIAVIRDNNNYSLTTKKHIAAMCKDFVRVCDADFYRLTNE